MSTSRLCVSITAAIVMLGCATTSRPGVQYDAQVTQSLTRLRDATRPFHTLDSAVASGYPREVRDCLVHEHHGAMGYHHANRGYADAKLELERPEILLYQRMPDGR